MVDVAECRGEQEPGCQDDRQYVEVAQELTGPVMGKHVCSLRLGNGIGLNAVLSLDHASGGCLRPWGRSELF